jgi:hypothetical protein
MDDSAKIIPGGSSGGGMQPPARFTADGVSLTAH